MKQDFELVGECFSAVVHTNDKLSDVKCSPVFHIGGDEEVNRVDFAVTSISSCVIFCVYG